MNVQRIVVGFDGSAHARKALERAADIAGGATLAVVCAAPVARLMRDPAGGTSPVGPGEAQAREQALAQAREYLEGRGITTVLVKGLGNPADVLVQEAQESSADLIVVGTRGLHAPRSALMGSVSTRVVHRAPCDVLVVR